MDPISGEQNRQTVAESAKFPRLCDIPDCITGKAAGTAHLAPHAATSHPAGGVRSAHKGCEVTVRSRGRRTDVQTYTRDRSQHPRGEAERSSTAREAAPTTSVLRPRAAGRPSSRHRHPSPSRPAEQGPAPLGAESAPFTALLAAPTSRGGRGTTPPWRPAPRRTTLGGRSPAHRRSCSSPRSSGGRGRGGRAPCSTISGPAPTAASSRSVRSRLVSSVPPPML